MEETWPSRSPTDLSPGGSDGPPMFFVGEDILIKGKVSITGITELHRDYIYSCTWYLED